MRFRPFPSLRGYRRSGWAAMLIAGLTVWAVLVPEALAYATIAGAPPVVGLYAAPGALILYAVFGSSRHLVIGPMSATAALSAAAVAQFATPGASAFVDADGGARDHRGHDRACSPGLLRLGFVANFISEPVLKGFIIGLALTIIAGQLPKLFGVEKGDGDFFEKIWDLITRLGDTHWRTLVVGLVSLAIVFGLRRFLPMIPGSLVAVGFGIGAVYVFDLDDHGVAIVGHIDGGLPSLGLPDVTCDAVPRARRQLGRHRARSASPRASGPPRPMPPAFTTRSTPTPSFSASAPPTSPPASRAAWSSTAASRRPPSTAAPAPRARSRAWSSPPSRS